MSRPFIQAIENSGIDKRSVDVTEGEGNKGAEMGVNIMMGVTSS